jgi:Protein of unknown function (DUF551)
MSDISSDYVPCVRCQMNVLSDGFECYDPACPSSKSHFVQRNGDWQPIESVPKDGRTVLLWSNYNSEAATYLWRERCWWASHEGVKIVESADDCHVTYKSEGNIFTHWMPLPAPPSPSDADLLKQDGERR